VVTYGEFPKRIRSMIAYGRISKRQLEIYYKLKEILPSTEILMEYKIKTEFHNYYLDIAIPSLNIDIEYDGWQHKYNVFMDKLRDEDLKNLGWRVIRIDHNLFQNIHLHLEELFK